VDYPFGLRPGCGHAGLRDLLFCINGALMLHLPSGSYRVMDVDYAYRGLTLHDPAMSDCLALDRSTAGRGNGFVVELWREPYLVPDPDNVFLLLGCHATSSLFQSFPDRHLPCRNVSGMGCADYYACPAWDDYNNGSDQRLFEHSDGSPLVCCAVPWTAIRAVNVTRLECEGYSSAYKLTPVHAAGGPPGGRTASGRRGRCRRQTAGSAARAGTTWRTTTTCASAGTGTLPPIATPPPRRRGPVPPPRRRVPSSVPSLQVNIDTLLEIRAL
jgi:hypothetical protein